MKIGMVCSGGGLRAFAFHLGVMRALEESGYRRRLVTSTAPVGDKEISVYVGSSAGACFVAAAAAIESLDDIERIIGLRNAKAGIPRLTYRKLFRVNRDLFRWGKRTAGFAYASGLAELAREMTPIQRFADMACEIYIPATQLNGPRKVIFGPRDSKVRGRYGRYLSYYDDVPLYHALAASSSLPLVFRPYKIKNSASGETFEYTDGEVRESLSMHVARDAACDFVIASNLWVPYSYQARHGSVTSRGNKAVLDQVIPLSIDQKFDKFKNDLQRYAEVLETVREFATWRGMPAQDIEALTGQLALSLNYRPMSYLDVAPPRDDADFIFSDSMSLNTRILGRGVEVGYASAKRALQEQTAG